MPTPFLALNTRSGTPQARRYIGATPSPFGVTFGTTDNNAGFGISVDHLQTNSPIVQFGGHQTFLAAAGGQIYRTTNAGAVWTSVYNMVTTGGMASSTHSGHAGLHVLYVDGVPRVVVQMYGGSGNWRTAYTLDGTSWVTGVTTTGVASNYAPSGVTIWRGKIYSATGGSNTISNIHVHDPGVNALTFMAFGSQHQRLATTAMCVFNDRLFLITYGANSGGTTIITFSEVTSSVTIIATLATVTAPTEDQHYGMFVDGAFMYLLYWDSTGATWRCIQVDSNLTRTEITATVLPTTMTTSAPNTSRVGVLVDQAFAGTAPTIFVYYSTSGSSAASMTCFKWNGPATRMTNVDSGGSAADAIPFMRDSDGTHFWTQGERHIEMVSRTRVLGGERISFKLYSPNASVDSVSVRAWQTDAQGEYPITAATLTSPSVGSMSGNTITGLDAADNGVTTFQVTWAAGTNGFVTGDRAKLIMEVFS